MAGTFNEYRALAQSRQMSIYASELATIKTQLCQYREAIVRSWQGREIEPFSAEVDQLLSDVNKLEGQLDNISLDIRVAAGTVSMAESIAGAGIV